MREVADELFLGNRMDGRGVEEGDLQCALSSSELAVVAVLMLVVVVVVSWLMSTRCTTTCWARSGTVDDGPCPSSGRPSC